MRGKRTSVSNCTCVSNLFICICMLCLGCVHLCVLVIHLWNTEQKRGTMLLWCCQVGSTQTSLNLFLSAVNKRMVVQIARKLAVSSSEFAEMWFVCIRTICICVTCVRYFVLSVVVLMFLIHLVLKCRFSCFLYRQP